MMFRPSSIFFANRKVGFLRAQLANVGQPVAEAAARRCVAQAWGWQSWDELLAALEVPGMPSPLDEDLVGPDAKPSVMGVVNARVVDRRVKSSIFALAGVLGLPRPICIMLTHFLRLTGRHATGTWLGPDEYRRLYADCIAPPPDWCHEIIDHGRRSREAPTLTRLPPHRPRSTGDTRSVDCLGSPDPCSPIDARP